MEVSLASAMIARLGVGACQHKRATGCGPGKLLRITRTLDDVCELRWLAAYNSMNN